MTTLWVLWTVVGVCLPVQPIDLYHSRAACQAQIDQLPEQQRSSIYGAKFVCEPYTVHGDEP